MWASVSSGSLAEINTKVASQAPIYAHGYAAVLYFKCASCSSNNPFCTLVNATGFSSK